MSVAPAEEEKEGGKVPSDEVERLCLNVKWEPDPNALGFATDPKTFVNEEQWEIVSCTCVFLLIRGN